MAEREAPALARLRAPPAARPHVPTDNRPTLGGRCLGAAAQLAAMHRTLRHGPALQLQPQGAARANRTGLPDRLKVGVEALSGVSLDGVKVHYNSSKPAQLNALAYAQGSDIHLAPGQEKHLPHEAWHIVQQAQGRVRPTMQLTSWTPINDDPTLEHEADLMGARALAARAATAGAARASVIGLDSHLPGPIQRKGGNPLQDLLPIQLEDQEFAGIIKAIIESYDNLPDARLAAQLDSLTYLEVELRGWIEKFSPKATRRDKKSVNESIKIVNKEMSVVRKQREQRLPVLEYFTRDDTSPYEQMAYEGMLWTHPAFKDRIPNNQARGTAKAYFESLSRENRLGMRREVKERNAREDDWFENFEGRAHDALLGTVVRHYTTEKRIKEMSKDNIMKSRTLLEKAGEDYSDNTSLFDDLVLANTGFLFFYIEALDDQFRGSRFAKAAEGKDEGREARISIPIGESGLLDQGWIMLSDFAQREYPDIKTRHANNELHSELKTRPEHRPQFDIDVRTFKRAAGLTRDEDASLMQEFEKTPSGARRQAVGPVHALGAGDRRDVQVYSGPEGKLERPEPIGGNILVGSDIVPGLARRTALEVSRISLVNPQLGKMLQSLSGGPLLRFMLKHMFRPQAMIPNSVKIPKDSIEYKAA